MLDYSAFAHTLYQILFTNPRIMPTVKLPYLIKLAQILDQNIPPEEKSPTVYVEAIEHLLPKELAPLSSDQIIVSINLLSVSRNPPIPKQRPPDHFVELCKLLVCKKVITAAELNSALEGTDVSSAVRAANA